MTPGQPAGAAGQPRGTETWRQVAIAVIGLAAVARLAGDTRTHEAAIVAVIAVAALAGAGRASRARSFARLAAWDKRRASSDRHTPRG